MFGKGSKFKKLEVLNVSGNPFCIKQPDYKEHFIFFCFYIKYIDYIFVDKTWRKNISSSEKFRSEILTNNTLKKTLDMEELQDKENNVLKTQKKLARMDIVENLHEEFKIEQDFDRIKSLHGVDDEVQKFLEKIKEAVEFLVKTIIQKNEEKLSKIRVLINNKEIRRSA